MKASECSKYSEPVRNSLSRHISILPPHPPDSFDYLPAWSPDSQSIAFSSGKDGNLEIYLMRADGSNQRRLTQNPASDAAPAFLDASTLVFVSDRDHPGESTGELYRIRTDGTEEIRLSQDLHIASPPSLGPPSGSAPEMGPLELFYTYDALFRPIRLTKRTKDGKETTIYLGYRGPSDRIAYMKDSSGEIFHKTSSAPGIYAYAQKGPDGTWRDFSKLYDQRGDTTALVNHLGTLVMTQSYKDWGVQKNPPSIPYGFLGSYARLHIPQTGLDLFGMEFAALLCWLSGMECNFGGPPPPPPPPGPRPSARNASSPKLGDPSGFRQADVSWSGPGMRGLLRLPPDNSGWFSWQEVGFTFATNALTPTGATTFAYFEEWTSEDPEKTSWLDFTDFAGATGAAVVCGRGGGISISLCGVGIGAFAAGVNALGQLSIKLW
jgi:hypothetical protein